MKQKFAAIYAIAALSLFLGNVHGYAQSALSANETVEKTSTPHNVEAEKAFYAEKFEFDEQYAKTLRFYQANAKNLDSLAKYFMDNDGKVIVFTLDEKSEWISYVGDQLPASEFISIENAGYSMINSPDPIYEGKLFRFSYYPFHPMNKVLSINNRTFLDNDILCEQLITYHQYPIDADALAQEFAYRFDRELGSGWQFTQIISGTPGKPFPIKYHYDSCLFSNDLSTRIIAKNLFRENKVEFENLLNTLKKRCKENLFLYGRVYNDEYDGQRYKIRNVISLEKEKATLQNDSQLHKIATYQAAEKFITWLETKNILPNYIDYRIEYRRVGEAMYLLKIVLDHNSIIFCNDSKFVDDNWDSNIESLGSQWFYSAGDYWVSGLFGQ